MHDASNALPINLRLRKYFLEYINKKIIADIFQLPSKYHEITKENLNKNTIWIPTRVVCYLLCYLSENMTYHT